MTTNIYKANSQWSNRPADQRFWTLDEAYKVSKAYADSAVERVLDFGNESLCSVGDNLAITVDNAEPAILTNWAFQQLARRANAPAEYLRSLPAALAAQCLESGLDAVLTPRSSTVNALIHRNGQNVVRAMTSEVYTRFWNHEVFARLMEMQSDFGWRVPPARPAGVPNESTRVATQADCLSDQWALSVKPGDLIAPAGIYCSDHDMFALMIREDRRIDDGSEGGISRGVIVSNSEVGAGALRLTTFGLRHVCGNHIIWDASNVVEVAIRHVGDVQSRFSIEVVREINAQLDASAAEQEALIKRAQKALLGKDRKEVLDAVFKAIAGDRRNGLPSGMSQKLLSKVYDAGLEYQAVDGDIATVYGYANAMTRFSQGTPYTDQRHFLDRNASLVLQVANQMAV